VGRAKGSGGMSTTVEIRDRYLAQLYREAYARHVEGLRLGLQEMHKTDMFPSTSAESAEGERGPVSPLGGKTW
jgi:hypothetical protein